MIRPTFTELIIEELTRSIGSVASLVLHSLAFIAAFVIALLGFAPWDTVLLVVTTVVSLEAIYLAIFIQMTVNRQAKDLREVSEDVEEIQEDIDEIQEDVEEMSEDWDLGTGKEHTRESIEELKEQLRIVTEKLRARGVKV